MRSYMIWLNFPPMGKETKAGGNYMIGSKVGNREDAYINTTV